MEHAQVKKHPEFVSSMRCLAAAAFAGMAVLPLVAADVEWKPQNGSTDISLPANWGGTVPVSGSVKWFSSTAAAGDYTVTIPAATVESPYLDKAGLNVYNLNNGQKVTFDASGTSWLQMTDAGTGWDGSKALRVIAGDHIFNIEGLNAANPNDNFGFSLTDGKISFKRDDANGSRLVFESGTFNNAFSPDGTASPHKNVFFHSTTAPAGSVVELAGGSVTFDQMEIRGKSADCEVLVSGGEHHVYDGIVINTGKGGNSTGSDAVLHVSGGSLTLESSCLWLGKDAGDKAVLRVDGTGRFEMAEGSQYIYSPDVDGASALLSIGGHGTWNVSKNFMAGHKAGSTTDILVEEDGYFNHTGYLQLPENSANASLVARDRARVRMTNASLAQGARKIFNMTVEDSATAEIKCGDIANNATAEFALDLKDDAVLKIGDDSGNINFGNNSGGKIDLSMTGGSLERYSGGEANAVIFRGGPESTYILGGVNIDTKSLSIQGPANESAPDAWYIVRQTNGVINVNRNGGGNGLDICGGKGRNAMYLLEGGELYIGNMLRVAYGNADKNNNWHAIYRQTGGFATMWQVNMCDNASLAEFELFGGRTRVYALRGWNNSIARNANGALATALFDGGTIEPWANGNTTIYTMPELRLGAKGLTFDTLAYDNILIDAKFQNEGEGTEDEVDGLFVKTGTGTLKANMLETNGIYVNRDLRSYHSMTRVDQGTLLLTKAADVAFGKNIIVKGGAMLSLAGTAETLTVDTLTLGDGHGFAVLKLDAGDTVVVEAANGVTANCGAIDVPSLKSTDGTYPVFTCKLGVLASELDKIAVHDGDATKDYAWTTEVDGDTGYTICSLIVAPKGTLTKTITYSSGTVTTNGTGKVSGIIAEETGTQSGELVLASLASASVDAGATLTVNGPLVGTGAEFAKSGSGKLVVGGSNPDFYGSFASGGGTFEVQSNAGFGTNPVNFPLILGNGTFKYTGEAVTFNSALKFQGATAGKSVILENDGDMTFTDVQHVSGTFVKKGVGALTLDLPAGSFRLGNDAVDGDYGVQHGAVVFPESGDAPESKTGLCGVTIAEGALKIKGEGVDKTTVSTENTSLLGTGYAAKAAPVLEVEDARVNFGKGSRHSHIMAQYPDGAPVPEIRLRNAFLYTNSGNIGNSSNASDRRGPIITMKDSVFWGDYNTYLGVAGFASPEIDADNSSFVTEGMNAVFGSYSKTEAGANSGGRLASQNHVTGEVKIRDGARMKTTRGINFAFGSLSVVFDGGIFEIASHNVESQRACTSVWQKAGTAFTTQGKGLEILIAEGSTHDFNFPVVGDGKVVKTGGGAFKLVEARAEGEKLLQYTGGTVVSNGTFVVDGSLVADGAKSFDVAEGAILDLNGSALDGATISGAGVVTNGTLSAATIAYGEDALPTFTDVTFDGTLTVDFDKTDEDPLDKTAAKAGIVVARYTGEAPANLRVKSVNTGIERVRTAVVCEGGDVIAKMTQSGFSVVIR